MHCGAQFDYRRPAQELVMGETGDGNIEDEPRLELWRSDTPGCNECTHLNNAGAALMPRQVSDAIHDHVDLESRVGGYEASEHQSEAIASVYDELAKLVGAAPRNIAIVGSATAAFIQAITSFDYSPGDVIVTSKSDYTSYQIQYLALSKRVGVRIIHAEDFSEGGVDPDSLRRILEREKCKLVSVSWMPTHSGLIQDAAAIGRVCEEAGVPLHLDACQAAGQVTIDAKELRCDYLSATGRKFLRGPRGIGFLYASDRALERGDYPLFVDMRGAEWVSPTDFRVADSAKRYEDWEFAYALVLGMGAAARYAHEQGIAGTG
ncbi:MAG: aminotransferase class V-fold PLP-dependent enzyme, partial [Gemmatimonadota bacterium]|nr:aminotransferase class V-fold PLP-dependent enzyme [Gemmatimonadota bacterium]